jgi:hypothetical protein
MRHMDTLVFDIETANFFTDPGVGWNNFEALKISVVGVYSYKKDAYFCYGENEFDKLAELFAGASKIVGFASNRYDIPVLNLLFQKMKNPFMTRTLKNWRETLTLWNKERVDLLDEIERATGKRISLSLLAEANLGIKKDQHPSEAAGMYERGEIEKLKEYCLKDVRLTKELYDIYERDRSFLMPQRETGEVKRIVLGASLVSAK